MGHEYSTNKDFKIACIGWGSLIYNLGILECDGIWREDGPQLPVEYVRCSDSGNLTLVILPGARPVKTFWTLMNCVNIGLAKESLRLRERFSPNTPTWIGSVELNNEPVTGIESIIYDWIKAKNINAAIWSNNPPKFNGENGQIPTIDDAIIYLTNLVGQQREAAEQYIRHTPKQVITEYREKIESELGWTYAEKMQ
jgi:hypothetical protein